MGDLDLIRDAKKLTLGDLDDSRPRDQKGVIRTPHGNATECFCISCGVSVGMVIVDTAAIAALCESCHDKHGGLPLPEVPESVVRGEGR